MEKNKPDTQTIIYSIITLAIVGIISFVIWGKPSPNETPDEVIVPMSEVPIYNIDPSKEIQIFELELLDSPYYPSANPYGPTYEVEAQRVTLGGEFKSILLSIQGEVSGEGLRFLSFNFDQQSGVINAVRSEPTKIDVEKTIEMGGAFDQNNPINVNINLLEKVPMSTTPKEYEKMGGSKEMNLWGEMTIKPPTVTYLLAAPFTEGGVYGGATITSIKASYVCEDGKECFIGLCPSTRKTTQCLLEAFGQDAVNEWCDNAGLDCGVKS